MQYLITFLEGLISFISPCMLPMLPMYVSYFGGGDAGRKNTAVRSAAFVAGFTVVFCLLGVFAGTLGMLLKKYQTAVNIVTGLIVIVFGLSYLGIIPLNFLKGMTKSANVTGVFSAFLFGMIYSVSLTPCVGAFLGSAIMLASQSGSAVKGLTLLFVYSMGLGVPFILSAVLLSELKGVFGFVKKHYKVIDLVCGIFLILIGVLMMTGLLNRFLSIL
ncbi:MAG: sulfite exporter TauE/SafE family protein [Lachnospiraceae bacterium]|nr:sulfite exporter TauE/SafE family protein [Lachnospiraceae bacterium]